MTLSAPDYGNIAEVLAKKIINYLIENKMLSDMFPGIYILGVNNITSKRSMETIQEMLFLKSFIRKMISTEKRY